jgi:DnaJ-class molecular chaperone
MATGFASSYAVYNHTTQLCHKCDGYGYIEYLNRGRTIRQPCQTCEGIGNVGGDIIEMRTTGPRAKASDQLLDAVRKRKLKEAGGGA